MTRALLFAQSSALALVLAWPAPRDLWTAAIGTPGGDVAKHVWNLWWARAEWRDGVPGLGTTLVNWPDGMRLFPIEPLNGLVAVAVDLPPVALSNLLALAALLLTGLCAGWLGWLVTGTTRGALTVAALVQGCSFSAFTLHVGVGELREVWWLPLGLGCAVRARDTRATGWFAATGTGLAVATLACFYHGLFLGTAVAIFALASLRRDRRLVLGYLGAAALALAVVIPVAHTFAASYGAAPAAQGGFLAWMRAAFQVDTFPSASLDLPDVLLPRHGARDGERLVYAYTGGRYLGWVAMGLAIAGAVAAPRRAAAWAGMAGVTVVLAMGTVVWWGGSVVELPFALPMVWINRALAWFAEPLNFPVRFLSVTMVAIAVLAAFAVERWPIAGALVPLALVDIARHDLVPWPRDMTPLPLGQPVAVPPGAVADLSLMIEGKGASPSAWTREGALLPSWITPELRTRAIGAQLTLDRPFQGVPIERQEMWALDGLLWTAALPLSEALTRPSVDDEALRASAWLLRERGFGAVILTRSCGGTVDAAARQALDRALGGRVDGGCFDLWPIPEVPASDGEATAWSREQARRFAELPTPTLQAQVPGRAPQ